jgi:uncharacterized C2H2 Zn-finger protein
MLEIVKERRGNQPRTNKRSRSGAQEECPHCQKKLRGAKGLKKHVADVHGGA